MGTGEATGEHNAGQILSRVKNSRGTKGGRKQKVLKCLPGAFPLLTLSSIEGGGGSGRSGGFITMRGEGGRGNEILVC